MFYSVWFCSFPILFYLFCLYVKNLITPIFVFRALPTYHSQNSSLSSKRRDHPTLLCSRTQPASTNRSPTSTVMRRGGSSWGLGRTTTRKPGWTSYFLIGTTMPPLTLLMEFRRLHIQNTLATLIPAPTTTALLNFGKLQQSAPFVRCCLTFNMEHWKINKRYNLGESVNRYVIHNREDRQQTTKSGYSANLLCHE